MNEFFDILFHHQCDPIFRLDESYADTAAFRELTRPLSQEQVLHLQNLIDRHADLRAHKAFAQGIRFTVSLAQTLYAEPDSYKIR